MIPGLCVPASMYDAMSAVLRSTGQFTCVIVDNRGMGRSDAPYAGIRGGAGYVATELAHDCWDVVDAVRAMRARSDAHSDADTDDEQELFNAEIAVVGHSMGGMIAQHMIALRPSQVRFVALLSTHAGGLWNLIPTGRMMHGAFKVAWSGFDRDVHAAVNLSLHFTQKFLDDWVGDRRHSAEHVGAKLLRQAQPHHRRPPGSSSDNMQLDNTFPNSDSPSASQSIITPPNSPTSQEPKESLPLERHRNLLSTSDSIGFVESKLLELAHDAHIHFGLTRAALTRALWKPRRALFRAIAKERRRARRRFDIYHAKYAGREVNPEDHHPEQANSDALSNPQDSPHAMYGHAAVVRSHYLASSFARKLRQCSRILKLVMLGRHDKVVTPAASRRLATAVGADTVVEVDAAHFITDEAAAEVTMLIVYGLRKAFFSQNGTKCSCEWCRKDVDDDKIAEAPSCRIC
ncbi:alpha/beta hydrolase domain containing protein [Gracilaria domingensis]|nr:alpha/beta hydrolase domain containing protein [Gracilaria domingensis]